MTYFVLMVSLPRSLLVVDTNETEIEFLVQTFDGFVCVRWYVGNVR